MGRQPSSSQKQPLENCANPVLAQWLEKWVEEAAANNSKIRFVYQKALKSVLECPERIRSGREAAKLKYIGDSTVKRIDAKIRELIASGGRLHEDEALVIPAHETADDASQGSQARSQKTNSAKTRVQKEYIPAFRSGPYATLIALHAEQQNSAAKGYLTRPELTIASQSYCSSPVDEGMFSILGGALKTLEQKGLLIKWGNPSRYSLSSDGMVLAERLWNTGERRSSGVTPEPDHPAAQYGSEAAETPTVTKEADALLGMTSVSKDGIMATASLDVPTAPSVLPIRPNIALPQACSRLDVESTEQLALHTLRWEANTYAIILLIDVREIKSQADRDFLVTRLSELGIACESRSLELGDMLWIARKPDGKRKTLDDSEEIVLDFIIERKRVDDLCSSIADGRFKEQKYRLVNCGIKKLIYLVEKCERADFGSIGFERFYAANIQTEACDGLFLRRTDSIEDTIRFLVMITKELCFRYKDKPLYCVRAKTPYRRSDLLEAIKANELPLNMTYETFSYINAKTANATLQDLFIKQLMAIRLVSAEKAMMVASKYRTINSLIRAYDQCENDKQREGMFKDYQLNGRKFGVQLSHRIYTVFCSLDYKD